MNLNSASALGTEPRACDFTKSLSGRQLIARQSLMQDSAVTPAAVIFFSASFLIAFVHLSETSAMPHSSSDLVLSVVWMIEKLRMSQLNASLLLFYPRRKEPAMTETYKQPILSFSRRTFTLVLSGVHAGAAYTNIRSERKSLLSIYSMKMSPGNIKLIHKITVFTRIMLIRTTDY